MNEKQCYQELQEKMGKTGIPEHMREGISGYVMYGVPLGNFLYEVFCNKLVQAAGRADEKNLQALDRYADFLYNHVPMSCWGNEESVHEWLGLFPQSIEKTSDKKE